MPLYTRDWFPGRVTNEYREGWDHIFKTKRTKDTLNNRAKERREDNPSQKASGTECEE